MKAQVSLETLLVIAALAGTMSMIFPAIIKTNEMSDYTMRVQKAIHLRDSINNGCRKITLMGDGASYSFYFNSPIDYFVKNEGNEIVISFDKGDSFGKGEIRSKLLSDCDFYEEIKEGKNEITIKNKLGLIYINVNRF